MFRAKDAKGRKKVAKGARCGISAVKGVSREGREGTEKVAKSARCCISAVKEFSRRGRRGTEEVAECSVTFGARDGVRRLIQNIDFN